MKYFLPVLLIMGCTTINLRSDSSESCVESVEKKMEGLDKTKLSSNEEFELKEILFTVCDMANNNPDLAMEILESIHNTH